MTNDLLAAPKPDLKPCIRKLFASIVDIALHGARRGDPDDIEFCNSPFCQEIIEALGIPATKKMTDLLPKIQSEEVKMLIHQ